MKIDDEEVDALPVGSTGTIQITRMTGTTEFELPTSDLNCWTIVVV